MNRLILFIFIIVISVGAIMVVANQNQNTKQASLNYSGVSQAPTNTQTTPADISPTQEAQIQDGQIAVTATPAQSSEQQHIQAQTQPNQQTPVSPKKAILKTSKGDITLELYPDVAPKTVANFATKATSGFYTNLIFHRVENWVVQGGDPQGNGTGGGNMPVEFNNKPFVVGSLGVASRGDGIVQNDAQFFITKTDASWLNGQYTNFGMVTEGMDVVNKMAIGDKILGITVE